MTSRSAAYDSLLKFETKKVYSNIEIDNLLKRTDLDQRDASLYTLLVYGVISKKITLDYIITKISGRNVKRLDAAVLTLLRLGIYQIKYCDRIPDSAAVNETVKLSSRYASRAKCFVNAVLRRACDFEIDYSFDTVEEEISVRYSVSLDIVKMLIEQYGEDSTRKILEFFDFPPKLTLTTNTLKTSREDLKEYIYRSCRGFYTPLAIRMLDSVPVSTIKQIDKGLCYVQDEASQVAAEILDAKPGMHVADVCSCPGGKSFYTAIKMNNEGILYSFDIHGNKLSLIESGAERLGITIIKTEERDGRFPREDLYGTLDRVLCDVPCSGIGVIGKKPDIRHKTYDDLKDLPEIQYDILSASSRYVKEGGILVYSTCTLNKKENEDVVKRFLSRRTEFSPLDFKLGFVESQDGMATLLPHERKTDGFFVARFIKNSTH